MVWYKGLKMRNGKWNIRQKAKRFLFGFLALLLTKLKDMRVSVCLCVCVDLGTIERERERESFDLAFVAAKIAGQQNMRENS